MVVEVLPDVSGIDRTFAYEVPEELAGSIRVGCIVRVVLHGRRVRGWVVAEVTAPPPEIDLRQVSELLSLGPPPAVVELCRWAAWRYSGRLRPLLLAASPPRPVRALPPALPPREGRGPGRAGRDRRARRRRHHLGRNTRAGDSHGHRSGSFRRDRRSCGFRRRRRGWRSSRRPSRRRPQATATCWSLLLRERTPSSLRSAWNGPVTPWQFSPRPGRRRQREAESSSERAPQCSLPWRDCVPSLSSTPTQTPTRKNEFPRGRPRCSRASVPGAPTAPCLLVSACPTLDLLSGRRLVTLSRDAERGGVGADRADRRPGRRPACGWIPHSAGHGDPSRSGHDAGAASPGRAQPERSRPSAGLRALSKPAALRRLWHGSGSARTTRPRRAGGASLPGMLSSGGPSVCASCGPTRPRIVRPGVARVREDLAALTGLDVAEVGRDHSGPEGGLPDAPVLVGTEAVLHSARFGFAGRVLGLRPRTARAPLSGRRAGARSSRSRVAARRWPAKARARRGQDAAGRSRGPRCRPTCRSRPARCCRGASPGTAPASPCGRARTGERGRGRRVRHAVGALGPGCRGGEIGWWPIPHPGHGTRRDRRRARVSRGRPPPVPASRSALARFEPARRCPWADDLLS